MTYKVTAKQIDGVLKLHRKFNDPHKLTEFIKLMETNHYITKVTKEES